MELLACVCKANAAAKHAHRSTTNTDARMHDISSKSEFLYSKQRTSRKDHRGIASLNRHIILVVFTNCRSVQRVLH